LETDSSRTTANAAHEVQRTKSTGNINSAMGEAVAKPEFLLEMPQRKRATAVGEPAVALKNDYHEPECQENSA
jgi:hypothetical protein